jgi:hypothetical protein
MTSKIRVFISSTMTDLANERDAIVRKITEFNFEPVNAESWLPNGSRSWERIQQELQSSHVFVLISGERYGWIPNEGPGAAEGLSVTEMETNAARAANIPILPFLKRLDYGSDSTSDEAKRRDAFRKRIGQWGTGQFLAQFDLASDLSVKVTMALVSILSESFLNEEVKRRSGVIVPLSAAPAAPAAPRIAARSRSDAPSIKAPQAILLAGSGMSLLAGYPSATALIELLAAKARENGDDVTFNGSIQEVARNFELAYGRESLVATILKGLNPPQAVQPTHAHRLAVKLFNVIVTTNFDTLFEMACEEAKIDYAVIAEDGEIPNKTTIVKIDGTLSNTNSLVLTTQDAERLRSRKPRLWQSLETMLRTRPIIIIGSSMRDANLNAMLDLANESMRGYIVAPNFSSFDVKRFQKRGLQAVNQDAESFLEALSTAN